MKSMLFATAIALAFAGASYGARAENGRNAAVIGGLAAGALLGGALSQHSAPPPARYEEEVEYEAPPPRCRIRQEPLYDRFGNVVDTRQVRFCR